MQVQVQFSRFEPVMTQRTDADAPSCMRAVHALALEPYRYLSSSRCSVLLSRVLTLLISRFVFGT